MGVAGGNGVGDYIEGIGHSAIGTPTSISTLSCIGAFCGYKQLWLKPGRDYCEGTSDDLPNLELNIAYGYAWMDTPNGISAMSDRKLHHGWVNLVKYLAPNVAVGLEYQYGFKQIAAGDRGEAHRLMLLVGLTTTPAEERALQNRTTDENELFGIDINRGRKSGEAYRRRL